MRSSGAMEGTSAVAEMEWQMQASLNEVIAEQFLLPSCKCFTASW